MFLAAQTLDKKDESGHESTTFKSKVVGSIPHRPYQKQTGTTPEYAWRRLLLVDTFSSN
jgi:hypothetical protein